MIVRVGLDIVETERIRLAMANPRFVNRILTARERSRVLSVAYVAGRWAAKEAIAKAVGTDLSWKDVEIENDSGGQPFALFRAGVLAPNQQIHLSITHERKMAAAVAILQELPSD